MLKTLFTSFLTTLQEQRERWILWAPVPLAAGIGVYFSLASEPPAAAGAIMLGFALVLLGGIYKDKRAVLVWLVFFLFALGFTAAQVRTWQMEAPTLRKKTHMALEVQGRVTDIDALAKSYRVTLDNLSFGGDTPQDPMPLRVRVRLKPNDPAIPEAGDIVSVKAILTPISKPVLPQAYDFQRVAYFEQLGATGYALSDMRVVVPHQTEFFFEDLRRAIRAKVAAANVGDKDTAALTIAFLIGDAGAISKHDWDVARESGIAHLIAISGSHFAMIVAVVFFMVRGSLAAVPYLALRWPLKKISAAAAMFMVVFYMLLIGAPIPAQRAVVMSGGILLAVMCGRDPFTLRLTALAAFLVMLLRPESLAGPSFQMSFAAVIGLVSFFESTREWWLAQYNEAGAFKRAGLFLLSCFLTTLAATVCTAPFSLFHFLRVSLLAGLVANMIAVPLSSFLTFPMGLIACALMPLGLEKIPLWITEKSIIVIMRVAEVVANWPHVTLAAEAWPAYWLAFITLGGLWVCIWRGNIRWLGLAPVLVAAVAVSMRPRPDILIGGNFKLLAAVRDAQGTLWLSPGRADKFIRDEWTQREAGDGAATWPEEGGAGNFLTCDARACVYRMKGQNVVFNKQSDFHPEPGTEVDTAALAQDCKTATLIVLPAAKKPWDCAAPVIDKWILYDDGAQMVYLNAGLPPRIVSVADARGDRPWTGERYKKPSPAY